MQDKKSKSEESIQHALGHILEGLVAKYAPGVDLEEGVSSRLMDFTLKMMIDILQEGGKLTEYTNDSCITANHIRIAIKNLKEKENHVDNEELYSYAKKKNSNKPSMNIEESKINEAPIPYHPPQLLYPLCTRIMPSSIRRVISFITTISRGRS